MTFARGVILALAAAAACGVFAENSSAPSDLTLILFDTAMFPNALCNDGSPAGYYFRKGTSETDWCVCGRV